MTKGVDVIDMSKYVYKICRLSIFLEKTAEFTVITELYIYMIGDILEGKSVFGGNVGMYKISVDHVILPYMDIITSIIGTFVSD